MISSRWYKVFNDLWSNKTRTILIVLSIAVGLFAVGTIISSRSILSEGMTESFEQINPSSGTVRTLELFDEDFVRSVRGVREVKDADARRVISTRVKTASGEWANLTLFIVDDYDEMRINKIFPAEGAWPPPERELLIERAALPVIEAEIGDVVLLELPNEKQLELRIAGTAHDMAQMPAQWDNTPYGYVIFETLEWFGEPYGFNELHIIAENGEDKDYAQYVVNKVKDKAERSGMTIPMSTTAEPGMLPVNDILQGILLTMATIGLSSLFLSAFLIINTVSALLTQQKRQIGVMKAIGASTKQLLGMYLVMVMFYGLAALVIAIPFSIVGARGLSRFMAFLFNFDLGEIYTPPFAIMLQVIVGLLVPVLASFVPFLANLRITAAEAMSEYQLGKGRFGVGVIDHLLSGTNLWFTRHVLMRPAVLSLRNTFRSKGRLVLTLATLTLAAAIFVSVFNLRASLFATIDDLMRMWNFDAMLIFSRSYRVERIRQEALEVPGVTDVDIWLQIPVRRVRPDGSESGMIYMFTPYADSKLAQSPSIVEGRWLLPDDENAIVITTNMVQDEPDIHVGSEVVLKIEGREQPWRVVGISRGMIVSMVYANYPYVAHITDRVGEADAALVAMERHDEAWVNRTTALLEEHFKASGLRVDLVGTLATERAEAEVAYGIIIFLLLIMAVLLAIVGGLGLMGTMSINVLERTREIGVLRAIGAPNRGVAKVFIMEGIVIGLMSWFLGSLLSLPLSKGLSDALGQVMAGAPLSFSFSMMGLWLWLVVVVILSALASFIPARNASRLTVREVLAYE